MATTNRETTFYQSYYPMKILLIKLGAHWYGVLNFGDGLLNMPLDGASVMSLARCVGLIVNFLMGCLVRGQA